MKNKRVSPHVLRHSTALNLLQHGVDRPVIAMWLGHESMDTTQIYLHASLELKEKALAKTEPFRGRCGRYRPPEQLLAFLQALQYRVNRVIPSQPEGITLFCFLKTEKSAVAAAFILGPGTTPDSQIAVQFLRNKWQMRVSLRPEVQVYCC